MTVLTVSVPTEWCSAMICVQKLTQLNRGVKRIVCPMPSVDESLSEMRQGKIFSKLDANSGFLQAPMD